MSFSHSTIDSTRVRFVIAGLSSMGEVSWIEADRVADDEVDGDADDAGEPSRFDRYA